MSVGVRYRLDMSVRLEAITPSLRALMEEERECKRIIVRIGIWHTTQPRCWVFELGIIP